MKSNEAYYQEALRDKDWRERQEKYLQESDFGGLAGRNFARSMRSLGYKEMGNAVNELVDNSLEAESSEIRIRIHCEEGKVPSAFFIGDNGHGMLPEMVHRACAWGESDRHGSKRAFGTFGFGLPSACVHFGDRYTVYSKTKDGDWNRAFVDINLIEDGKMLDSKGRISPDGPKVEKPPKWAMDYFDQIEGDGSQGTIVLVDKFFQKNILSSKDSTTEKHIAEIIGITYRNYLSQVNVFVGDQLVEAVDPLFLRSDCKWHMLPDDGKMEGGKKLPWVDRPVEIPGAEFSVDVNKNNPNQGSGEVRIRISYCPFSFFRKLSKKTTPQITGKKGQGVYNERFTTVRRTHGIMILRKGRQIDVIQPPVGSGIQTWTNNHRYVRVEIDFDPVLDQEFQVTTSKQQIRLSDRMWNILEKEGLRNGIQAAMNGVNKSFKEANAFLNSTSHLKEGEDTRLRPSEEAMIELSKISKDPSEEASIREKIRGQENIIKEVDEAREKLDLSAEDAEELIHKRTAFYEQKQREVKQVSRGADAPFYEVEPVGIKARRLRINKDHRFFEQIYSSETVSAEVQWNLELLLFTLGELELDSSSDEWQQFMQRIRREWSHNLDTALAKIEKFSNIADQMEVKETEHLADYKEEDNS